MGTERRVDFPTAQYMAALAGLAAAVFLFAIAGVELTIQSGRIASFWLANAVVLAVLLRQPTKTWSGWVIAALLGNIAADLVAQDSAVASLLLSLCNIVEIVLAASAMRFLSPNGVTNLTQPKQFFVLVSICGLLSPAVASLLAAGVLHFLDGVPLVSAFVSWFTADALGMLILIPLLCAITRQEIASMVRGSRWVETLALLIGAAALSAVLFWTGGTKWTFLLSAIIVGVAIRRGYVGAALSTFLIVGAGILSIAFRRYNGAPVGDVREDIQYLQLFALVSALTAIPIASVFREAQARRRLLQTVFDTIPLALSVKDAQSRYVMVNGAWCERYGLTAAQVIGTPTLDVPMRGEDAKHTALEQDLKVFSEGKPIVFEGVATIREGERRQFRTIKAPLRDETGRVSGIVGAVVDQSELKRAEEKLRASERLLQTVFDTIPHMIVVKDREGRILMANPAYLQATGYSAEDIANKLTRQLPNIPDSEKAQYDDEDRKVLESESIYIVGDRLFTVKGPRQIPIMSIKAPLRDASGTVIGLVGVFVDISDRLRAERELRESKALLQAIFDTIPHGIFVQDAAYRFLMVNYAFSERWHRTPESFIGETSPKESGAPAKLHAIEASDRQVIEEGRSFAGEFDIPSPNGSHHTYHVIKTPLRDVHGTIVGLVGLSEDITARKKGEDDRIALERLMQRTQSLESLGAMAGGIAHDFNNLLQRILGYAELTLLEVAPDSPAYASVKMIYDAGASAAELTRQMQTLSGRSHFALDVVDLNQFALFNAPLAKELIGKLVKLHVAQGASGPMVLADAPLLWQVLQSLINNAREAMEPAGGDIYVTTGSQEIEGGALDETYSDRDLDGGTYGYVEVRDTGPGLPAEVLARLYEPFHSTKFMGRGLGLAAVRGIVRGHRGTIQAFSPPGGGTAFRILLPAISETSATKQ